MRDNEAHILEILLHRELTKKIVRDAGNIVQKENNEEKYKNHLNNINKLIKPIHDYIYKIDDIDEAVRFTFLFKTAECFHDIIKENLVEIIKDNPDIENEILTSLKKRVEDSIEKFVEKEVNNKNMKTNEVIH